MVVKELKVEGKGICRRWEWVWLGRWLPWSERKWKRGLTLGVKFVRVHPPGCCLRENLGREREREREREC